jgi:hypothetical protein
MTTTWAAGGLLVAVPLAFNAAFALLAARFDYPDVLRRPTSEVLAAFRAGGSGLVLLWWGFAATAALMMPLVVLLSEVVATDGGAHPGLLATATTIGVLAALVQLLGLVRWPFLVPFLARADAEPGASEARKEAVDVVFQAFNRYLGVGVGEHLGYALTGIWSALIGVAMLQAGTTPLWLALLGVAVGAVLLLCSFEFVGRHEERGWKVAERLTPVTYVVWSLWLIATGVAVLIP